MNCRIPDCDHFNTDEEGRWLWIQKYKCADCLKAMPFLSGWYIGYSQQLLTSPERTGTVQCTNSKSSSAKKKKKDLPLSSKHSRLSVAFDTRRCSTENNSSTVVEQFKSQPTAACQQLVTMHTVQYLIPLVRVTGALALALTGNTVSTLGVCCRVRKYRWRKGSCFLMTNWRKGRQVIHPRVTAAFPFC